MKGLAIGSVLAAIAMFLFGFLYFGPLNGLGAVSSGADTGVMQEALRSGVPATGTYVIPDMSLYLNDADGFATAHEAGPRAMLHVQKAGAGVMDVKVMIVGFVHMLVVAFILGVILQMVLPAVPTYAGKIVFIAILGLLAGLWVDFGQVVWWSHPVKYHMLNTVYHVVSFAIAGAVLGKFVKSP